MLAHDPSLELLWASPREVLNIVQAEEIGVHIITVTHDLLAKLSSFGKDLDEFSLETVQMFHRRRARPRGTRCERRRRGSTPTAPTRTTGTITGTSSARRRQGQPGQRLPPRLVLKLLGTGRPGATLLDIGSGQGQFALDFKRRDNPQVDGVRRRVQRRGSAPRHSAAERAGASARLLHEREPAPAGRRSADGPAARDARRVLRGPRARRRPGDPDAQRDQPARSGRQVVVTVPGGPRSAFDKHIGHFRHFTAPPLCTRSSPTPASTSSACCGLASRSSTSTSWP